MWCVVNLNYFNLLLSESQCLKPTVSQAACRWGVFGNTKEDLQRSQKPTLCRMTSWDLQPKFVVFVWKNRDLGHVVIFLLSTVMSLPLNKYPLPFIIQKCKIRCNWEDWTQPPAATHQAEEQGFHPRLWLCGKGNGMWGRNTFKYRLFSKQAHLRKSWDVLF